MNAFAKESDIAEIDTLLKELDGRSSHWGCVLFRRRCWQFSTVFSCVLKRFLDIAVSFVALCLLFFPFILLAALIKLTSRGPAVYIQTRVGQWGRHFKFYKFRSMHHEEPDEDEVKASPTGNAAQKVDAEDRTGLQLKANSAAMELDAKGAAMARIQEYRRRLNVDSDQEIRSKVNPNDPNITPIGRFIRKTSIDELPQFYNVFKGEMSLVGPRPPVPSEVNLYPLEARKRLDVKPGLTCLWQIRGRSDLTFEQQVDLDKEYILNQSLMRDLVIMVQTVPAIIIGKGAY